MPDVASRDDDRPPLQRNSATFAARCEVKFSRSKDVLVIVLLIVTVLVIVVVVAAML